MNKYKVVAYADPEEGLSKKTSLAFAETREEAMAQAWKIFPEYHEVNVFLIEDK